MSRLCVRSKVDMAISLNVPSGFRYKARRIRFMKEMGVLALQWREDTKSISWSVINGVVSKVMVRLRVTNIVDHVLIRK
jgi:hypothetical protein